MKNEYKNIMYKILLSRDNQLDISCLNKRKRINIYLKIPNIIRKEYNYIYEYINNNLDNIKA